MIRFAVLSMPRTGSTMVVEKLGSHPDVTCYLALFSKREFFATDHPPTRALRDALSGWDVWEDRHEKYAAFMADVVAGTPPCKAMGIKQHINGPKAATQGLLADPDVRLISLVRRNHLATYSSAQIALQKGWNNRRTIAAREQPKVAFDAGQFEKHICAREHHDRLWSGLIAERGGKEIDYARARTADGAAELWEFIGVDPALGGDTTLVKNNSEDFLQRFENPGDVQDWLEAHDRTDWLEPEIQPPDLGGRVQ
ncbi:hypothetical protein [Parasphingopyxis marina]|uniref:Sulfotransferase family protein n=1 Tax=Parasphingopyxis marina TaxID=2761622 RepID=A0A842I0T5_9SPHN|nr:hypothetical protein [Parasphingopyxis marina]MBC2777790.1 hypothetical protein [Parasphingopyxis marina]